MQVRPCKHSALNGNDADLSQPCSGVFAEALCCDLCILYISVVIRVKSQRTLHDGENAEEYKQEWKGTKVEGQQYYEVNSGFEKKQQNKLVMNSVIHSQGSCREQSAQSTYSWLLALLVS